MPQEKVIIVTGGGSGIGRATARILAKAGVRVLVTDFNQAGAEQTAALIEQDGGIAKAMRVNVIDEGDVIAMVDRPVEIFGRIDGAFNNAGVPRQKKLVEELDESDWDKVMDVNLKGVFFCMNHEIAAMWPITCGAVCAASSINTSRWRCNVSARLAGRLREGHLAARSIA